MTDEGRAVVHYQGREVELPPGVTSIPETVEEQATLLQKQWGSSTDLNVEDFTAIARIADACGMNPIFDLDVLGGQPYDKSDFWKGLVVGHPDYVSHEMVRVMPEDVEWEQWIGISESGVVAAAVMLQIDMRGRAKPVIEANYVKKLDSILYEYGEPVHVDSKEEALERAGETGTIYYKKKGQPWAPQGWYYRAGKLKPDWEGLALKKARTTVWRRAGKIAVPRRHARILNAMDQMQKIADRAGQRATAALPSSGDPYAEDKGPSVEEGSSTISESHRRGLMALANRKGFEIEEVHEIMGRIFDLPPSECHTSNLTYEQLEKLTDHLAEMDDVGGEVEVEGQDDDSEEEEVPENRDGPNSGPSMNLWGGGPGGER